MPGEGTDASRTKASANLRASLVFFTVIAIAMIGIHVPLLDMPYFWDELGQFIPASLDLYSQFRWVPVSTLPNIHPPGLMALLAGVWSVAGYSIVATRLTMLLLASLSVFLAFRLTLQLAGGVPGLPGFVTPLLLFASPLFYTQAMMAQLDLPATLFTLLALSLFFDERILLSVAACTALVWMKETGAVLPVILGLALLREKRNRQAALFLIPCFSLLPWLFVLWRATGSVFGNREFAEFNMLYPLHPARLGLALLRRFYELFLNHGYLLGAAPLAVLWKRSPVFARREWRILLAFVVLHVLAVCVTGGAVLERYLLPVLPLVLMAYAIAWSLLGRKMAVALPVAVALLSGSGFFLEPPFPQPLENDLRMTRQVKLFETAATWIERRHPDALVATAWPLSDGLRDPRMGYVGRKLRVAKIDDFSFESVERVSAKNPDVFVLYSNDSFQDSWIRQRFPYLDDLREALYGWEPELMGRDVEDLLKVREEARWSVDSFSIAVYARGEVWNDGSRGGVWVSSPPGLFAKRETLPK